MADGLLSGLTNWIDQRKQAAKASIGLLADNPQEWAAQATARYFPTKEEERQFRMVKEMGGDITQTPYYQKVFDLTQFQGSIKAPNVGAGVSNLPDKAMLQEGKQKFLESSVVKQPVYHGTIYTERGKPDEAILQFKQGRTWFSGNPEYANTYAGAETKTHGIGGYVLPLNVRMTNPKIFPATTEGLTEWGKNGRSDRLLKNEGYDGVLFIGKDGELRTGYVFDQKQIKSAIGNRGEYDIENPSIVAAGIPLGLLGSTQVELPKKQEKKPKK